MASRASALLLFLGSVFFFFLIFFYVAAWVYVKEVGRLRQDIAWWEDLIDGGCCAYSALVRFGVLTERFVMLTYKYFNVLVLYLSALISSI